MLKRLFLIITALLMFASPASASTSINISVEVVVLIGNYTNSSVNLSTNQTTLINAPEANTTLELASSQNISGALNLILTSTPVDVPSLSVPSLDKFLKIEASEPITNNLTYAVIKLYYTEKDVIASGIEEGSLSFYWWNRTSYVWEKLTPAMDWVHGAGVDTVENYVWANVTHFSDYSVGGLRMPPSIEITRDLPLSVKTNQKFDTNLHLANLADFELFDIYIKETIPEGYNLKEDKKIYPKPLYIKEEKGSKVIYWKIDWLASHTDIILQYSLSAPKSPDNYTFRADAFGFDAFNNKYATVNVTVQEVKKPPLWKSVLEIFGISE